MTELVHSPDGGYALYSKKMSKSPPPFDWSLSLRARRRDGSTHSQLPHNAKHATDQMFMHVPITPTDPWCDVNVPSGTKCSTPNADTFDTYFAAEHQVCLTDFLALLCCTTNLSNG